MDFRSLPLIVWLGQTGVTALALSAAREGNRRLLWLRVVKNYDLYIMLVPVVAYFIIFHYIPMYGIQIAFKKFSGSLGIWGSPWVGFEHFIRFFKSFYFTQTVSNTLLTSLYTLALGFPAPIILALMMNEVRSNGFRRTVQTVTYAPNFISVVVIVGMLQLFLSPQSGFVNKALEFVGLEPVNFMYEPGWFKTIYVLSGVWQSTGWGSIIYMAALSGIDPQLHEAAIMDGAKRLRRIWHINLPGIMPTAVIMLILACGSLMSVGFEKVFLMMNDLNRSSADVISTYVYRAGLIQKEYSFASAVGLFNSVVNFILLALVNTASRKMGDTSLW